LKNGTLIVMLKAPVAGNVKTRLGAEIGYGRSAALFRIMTRQTIARVDNRGWETLLAVDPQSALGEFHALWPTHLSRIPQAVGDLGQRMIKAMDAVPFGSVVVIGADAPGVRAHHIKAAFSALRGAEEDGGYWLIGLARRRSAPDLFDGVRWSTKHTLDDTITTLPNSYKVKMLPIMSDIDEMSELHLLGLLSTR